MAHILQTTIYEKSPTRKHISAKLYANIDSVSVP